MKLKKGDLIKVKRGKDKGKTGKIEKIFPKKRSALITGVNQYKRHLKARSNEQKSEIVTITKSLSLSSVILICPKCGKYVRTGFALKDGKKERICKKCKKSI